MRTMMHSIVLADNEDSKEASGWLAFYEIAMILQGETPYYRGYINI